MPVNLVILGLGNPGPNYEHSRHNVGHWFVNYLAELHQVSFYAASFYQICSFPFAGGKLTLAKSVNYMNENGLGVRKFLINCMSEKDEFVIVHDELDLPIGRAKFSQRKSAAGHNGVSSVLNELDFSPPRLRIGIDAIRPRNFSPSEFVLSRFSSDELLCLDSLLPPFIESLRLCISRGLSFAMNYTNSYPLTKPASL